MVRLDATRIESKPAKTIRSKRNPFSIPLVCHYRAYVKLRDHERVIRNKTMCGRIAPRRSTGDRSQPKYPSRTGDPLCRTHRIHANDPVNFPIEEVPKDVIFR